MPNPFSREATENKINQVTNKFSQASKANPSLNAQSAYNNIARGDITKDQKTAVKNQLLAMANGPMSAAVMGIVRCLIQYKVNSKRGGEAQAAGIALAELERYSAQINDPTLSANSMMAFVKNRSSVFQRQIPETFAELLRALVNAGNTTLLVTADNAAFLFENKIITRPQMDQALARPDTDNIGSLRTDVSFQEFKEWREVLYNTCSRNPEPDLPRFSKRLAIPLIQGISQCAKDINRYDIAKISPVKNHVLSFIHNYLNDPLDHNGRMYQRDQLFNSYKPGQNPGTGRFMLDRHRFGREDAYNVRVDLVSNLNTVLTTFGEKPFVKTNFGLGQDLDWNFKQAQKKDRMYLYSNSRKSARLNEGFDSIGNTVAINLDKVTPFGNDVAFDNGSIPTMTCLVFFSLYQSLFVLSHANSGHTRIRNFSDPDSIQLGDFRAATAKLDPALLKLWYQKKNIWNQSDIISLKDDGHIQWLDYNAQDRSFKTLNSVEWKYNGKIIGYDNITVQWKVTWNFQANYLFWDGYVLSYTFTERPLANSFAVPALPPAGRGGSAKF